MTAVPDYVPMLIKGASEDPKEGGCLVQIANWLVDPQIWSDDDLCVNRVLAEHAVRVNDAVSDAGRHELALLAPRLAGTKGERENADEREVENQLEDWICDGAGSGYPLRWTHPAHTETPIPNGKIFTFNLGKFTLVHDDAYAIAWLTALIDEYDRITGCNDTPELPVERWLEIKELVGQ